jgi:hypothetical protein
MVLALIAARLRPKPQSRVKNKRVANNPETKLDDFA